MLREENVVQVTQNFAQLSMSKTYSLFKVVMSTFLFFYQLVLESQVARGIDENKINKYIPNENKINKNKK